MQRSKKIVSLIYLACGLVSWLLFRELVAAIWVVAHLPMPVDWVVAPADLIAAAMGVATFVILWRNARVVAFTNEVLTELGKVVWPARKETALSTGVVSVLVAICAVILFFFDMMWGALVRIFYQ
jgi:preprotein translocase SecE subunit